MLEWPVFTPRSGAENAAVAEIIVLRALVAKNLLVSSGLFAVMRHCRKTGYENLPCVVVGFSSRSKDLFALPAIAILKAGVQPECAEQTF